MSRGSQDRRATKARARAKQRARDAAGSRSRDGRAAFGFPFPPAGPGNDRAQVRRILVDAMRAGLPPESCARRLAAFPPTVVRAEAAELLEHLLLQSYEAGWQPAELIRLIRQRVDAAAAGLVGSLVAADWANRRHDRVDPRWRRQMEGLELDIPVDASDWLGRWSAVRGGADAQQWITVLRTVAELGTTPTLEVLIPPPPGINPRRPAVSLGEGADADPELQRIRALLAKAESTNHEAEATAFTAKAQELMTRHAIDVAMLEGTAVDPAAPSIIRLPVDPPYSDVKAFLLQTVAQHTRCRSVLHSNVLMSSVVGHPTDLEAVDLLFTSLLVQAQHALTQASADAPPGTHRRSQGFRSAFLQGFTIRIGDRLAEVNRLAYTDERAETFLPVLRSREERIDDLVDEQFPGTTSGRVRGGHDWDGFQRGELAGEAAKLTAGSVED